jgi:hypothetical protein
LPLTDRRLFYTARSRRAVGFPERIDHFTASSAACFGSFRGNDIPADIVRRKAPTMTNESYKSLHQIVPARAAMD